MKVSTPYQVLFLISLGAARKFTKYAVGEIPVLNLPILRLRSHPVARFDWSGVEPVDYDISPSGDTFARSHPSIFAET